MNRKLVKVENPGVHPGFLGPGHQARAIIQGEFSDTDPFILMMDDMLDKKDNNPVGGPHPHAGFETVTLLLEGEIGDETHTMHAGDFQIMTAGSGIVHTETINKIAKLRLLQLWLALPPEHRWTKPRIQDLPADRVPNLSENGTKIRLYSGNLLGLKSPVQNYVPLIVAEVKMEAGSSTLIKIPGSYNTFLYVIEGRIEVGEEETRLGENQVGWLNRTELQGESELILKTETKPAHLVLYSAEPTGKEIVSHGPFIADNPEQIQRLYRDFRSGKMNHISTVPQDQRFLYQND